MHFEIWPVSGKMCFAGPLQQMILYQIIALVWLSLPGLSSRPLLLYLKVCWVVALSPLYSSGCACCLLPAQQQSKIGPSQCLAPRSGVGSLLHFTRSPGSTHFQLCWSQKERYTNLHNE